PITLATYMGKLMSDMKNASPEMPEGEAAGPFVFTPAADSPLLRELRAELEREAMRAVETAASQAHEKIQRAAEEIERRRSATAEEFFRRMKEETEQLQSGAREQFSNQLRARQNEFLGELKSEFEENFRRVRELMAELDRQALRAESEAAAGDEAARVLKQPGQAPGEDAAGIEAAGVNWRGRAGTGSGRRP